MVLQQVGVEMRLLFRALQQLAVVTVVAFAVEQLVKTLAHVTPRLGQWA